MANGLKACKQVIRVLVVLWQETENESAIFEKLAIFGSWKKISVSTNFFGLSGFMPHAAWPLKRAKRDR
jgi:hypothetical protein